MQNVFVGYFLAGFYTFVAVFYTLLVIKRNESLGKGSCIQMGEKYSLHWFNHLTFRIFRIIIWLVCILHVLFNGVDPYLIPLPSIDYPLVNAIGVLLVVTGFNMAIVSNMNLASAWRSGIDKEASATLVTQGLYAISRNPGFVGVGLSQIGFFMALPCVFSLICMLVGLNALRIQAKLEEQFLQAQFADQYASYKTKVPKWILR